MKNIILILVLGIFANRLNVHAQDAIKCKDTITVFFTKHEDFKKKIEKAYNYGYYLNDTIYYIKNKKAKRTGKPVLDAFNNGKFYNCSNKSKFKFFQFYTKERKLIAEGFWDLEGFQGLYREYYKTGQLQEEGYRNGDWKIKMWKYYDESGKLIKEDEYDEKGSLLSTKNH